MDSRWGPYRGGEDFVEVDCYEEESVDFAELDCYDEESVEGWSMQTRCFSFSTE